MNSEYQSVYRQADALRHRFKDYVDAPNDSEARALYSGLDRLAEDIERQLNGGNIEQQAKRLAEEFKRANSHPTHIMSPEHLSWFKEQLEEIAQEARRFPRPLI
jgi:hypothetical protein